MANAGNGRLRPGAAMRAFFLVAILSGVFIGTAVAGVRALTRDGGEGTNAAATGTPAATVAGSSETPRVAAERFAQAWSAGEYERLYGMLDGPSQASVPLGSFTAEYTTFATELTLRTLVAKVASADGASAKLTVHAATAYFGDFEYSTTLNLSKTGGRWFVAWSPAVIHPDLAGGRHFKSSIQRAARGSILDRNGAPLAVTKEIRFLGLNRSVVQDRAALTATLGELGFTKDQVDAAFNAPGGATQRVTVGPVADGMVEAAALAVRSLPGAILYFESQRVHPLGGAAAHVVGYTREFTAEELDQRRGQGYRVGDRVGATGLEASLEKRLAGQHGAELRLVESDNTTVVRVVASREYTAGQDVRTTLDSATLVAAQARLGSRAGAAVVLDPRTNGVLAMNSSPTFDPDAFERNDRAALQAIANAPGSPQANRASTGLYSAGSTFKLITGAAGLLSGLYRTTDTIFCGAVWDTVSPARRNWEGTQGPQTIAQALMRSCNPVFYEIAYSIYQVDGKESFLSDVARMFGFGTETGAVGISDEAGLVPDPAWKKKTKGEIWYPGDSVNLGIGQGDLLITPLQLANAYSSFTAGALRTPVIIQGEEAKVRNEIPLSAEQSAHLKLGLRLVTSATGTASAAFANAGYTDFAGKSGTAEDAGAQQHVLFVALSPAAAPRAVAAVVLDEGGSGSIEAGPIARDIVLTAIR